MAADFFAQTSQTLSKVIGNPILAVREDAPQDISLANANFALLQADTAGALRVTEDGGIPTYTASVTAMAVPASATDVFVLANSTTKVVRVTRVRFTCTAANAVTVDFQVSKLSTLPTGGTATVGTTVPMSTSNPTATAVFSGYTTLPTLGTHVGAVRSDRYLIPVTSTGVVPAVVDHDFRARGHQGFRLATGEGMAINFAAATTLTTGVMTATVEWMELPLTA